jgi:hypothetical protein
MSKARTLAGTVSTGAVLADGTVDAAEIGNLTLPTGGDIVGTTATQTLTNKTLTDPIVSLGGTNGTSGQVLTSAGTGAAPTWSSPATSGSFTATASGTIPDVATVILKSDGTVEAVTSTGSPAGFGSSTQMLPFSSNTNPRSCYDSVGQKVVVLFGDALNSNFLTAVVGTISGSTITFGSKYVVRSSSAVSFAYDCDFDPVTNRVLFVYSGQLGFGQGKVGTISGTALSFGSENNFLGWRTRRISCGYDSTSQKFLVSAYDDESGARGQLCTATISGTSVSFGSLVNMGGTGIVLTATQVVREPVSGALVVTFMTSSNIYAAVCTISGTSVTVNSVANFSATYTSDELDAAPAGNNSFVVAYRNASSGIFYSRVATISGTAITWGAQTTILNVSTLSVRCEWDSINSKVLYVMNGRVIPATVSGTTITIESSVELSSSTYMTVTFLPNVSRFGIIYSTGTDTRGITFKVSDLSSNLVANPFIGFSGGSYTNGQTATVKFTGSVITGLSSLTPGQKYYVQYTGALATTADLIVGSIYAGLAISSTSLAMN